ncbi:MAG: hypothetical protein H7Z74_12625 [Anaerolineae bacterium]|nr:hypothetical protein [Gemmatimonadaceae bacterium]
MQFRSLLAFSAVLLTLAFTSSTAASQKDDDEDWMERCRSGWGNDDSDRERFCEIRELGMRSNGKVIAVDAGRNGGVSIRGWDRDSVHVRVKIQTQDDSEAGAKQIASQVKVETGGDVIRADGPDSDRRGSWSASFEIFVPRRSDLRLETHNGPISVREVSGAMQLDAHNGPLSLKSVGGDVHGRTQNGPLAIELSGAKWDGAGLDAETRNGPVILTIPESYSAQLETGTVNGPMTLGFPLTLSGRINRRISTTLGQGGPTVRAVTTNGPVTLKKGGK